MTVSGEQINRESYQPTGSTKFFDLASVFRNRLRAVQRTFGRFDFGQVPYYQKTRCQLTGGVITIGEISPPLEIYPSVGSGHHRTKRKKARRKQRAQNALSVFNDPEQGVLGKMNRGDWI